MVVKPLCVFLIFPLVLFASYRKESPLKLSLRQMEKGGIGYQEGYSTLALCGSWPRFKKSYFFIDGRGHRFDSGSLAANAGIGFRYDKGVLDQYLGANVYYDYRSSRGGFQQLGCGLDFRKNRFYSVINGYWPLEKNKRVLKEKRFTYSGGYWIVESQIVQSYTHLDLELGYTFVDSAKTKMYLGGGPYLLKDSCDCKPLSWGGMGRVRMNFWKCFYIEGIVSHDSQFHTKVQGQISLTLPYPRSDAYRTIDSVSRQEIIPLSQRKLWKWNY